MEPNPQFAGAPAPSPAGSNAKDTLNVPSILLIITGAIGVLSGLSSLVRGGGGSQQMMNQLGNNPELQKFATVMTGPGNIIFSLLGIALSGLIIFGAIKMRNLQSHGLAMAAAIVAMIPCGGCCCIGLPVGIWALVLMMKPEVKSQFQA